VKTGAQAARLQALAKRSKGFDFLELLRNRILFYIACAPLQASRLRSSQFAKRIKTAYFTNK
jgi:hypothetical protein